MTDVTGSAGRTQQYFTDRGHTFGGTLGQGMEGTVYDLGGDVVGKVWYRRGPEDLAVLQQFYAELATHPSPIRFPEILEVGEFDGRSATVERKLTGTTLRARLQAGTATIEQGRECVLEVLAVLREIPAGAAARRLPVVDEARPLWPTAAYEDNGNAGTWSRSLHALVERRVELFGDQLRAAVTDFDAKLARILAGVRRLPETPLRVVHGDLVPDNILVDEACRPLAVLDWGFLSTAGDPAFEAALAAGLFDMYGAGARESEAELFAGIQDSAGYPPELMHLYRAVYAVVTSNVYDSEGQDGHFAWCVASLERDDIVAAL
ncbi:MAG: phosphotransferase [Catenulispora sp.]|nr:phosphotransferase [Catenulispora sp.]